MCLEREMTLLLQRDDSNDFFFLELLWVGIESRMKEREIEMTIMLIERKKFLSIGSSSQFSFGCHFLPLYRGGGGERISIRHRISWPFCRILKDDFRIRDQRSEIGRWWGWPIFCCFCFCFMSRMICIIFVWFVSAVTIHLLCELCPSIAFVRQIYTEQCHDRSVAKESALFCVLFHPVRSSSSVPFLPSNPSDGALYNVLDSVGHVPS